MMFKLELSEQMMMAIVQVLRSGPYNIVAPILDELQKQVNPQVPQMQMRGMQPSNGYERKTVVAGDAEVGAGRP